MRESPGSRAAATRGTTNTKGGGTAGGPHCEAAWRTLRLPRRAEDAREARRPMFEPPLREAEGGGEFGPVVPMQTTTAR
jgi:hypothetical protein